MDGYEEARRIDKILSDLLEKYPIESYYRQWWKLTRTVKSTLDIIDYAVMDIFLEKEGIRGISQ